MATRKRAAPKRAAKPERKLPVPGPSQVAQLQRAVRQDDLHVFLVFYNLGKPEDNDRIDEKIKMIVGYMRARRHWDIRWIGSGYGHTERDITLHITGREACQQLKGALLKENFKPRQLVFYKYKD